MPPALNTRSRRAVRPPLHATPRVNDCDSSRIIR